jgi:tight adherence protein B
MTSPILISVAVFIAVTTLIVAIATVFRERSDLKTEDRLAQFTTQSYNPSAKEAKKTSLLDTRFDAGPSLFSKLLIRVSKLRLLFEQADTSLTPSMFFVTSVALAAAGWGLGWVSGSPMAFWPLGAIIMGLLPLVWLMLRRRKRFRMFAQQLPDALELISRALRAGHSLASGFNLVRDEMSDPIGREFGRVFEENNLGVSIDDSLRSLTDRIPNLDLKFFSTAVVLQRQTGGDLSEILDKISHLIRERFKIWGQIQALTGEGRLSGVVLLALPPVLFLAVYRLNHDYIMMLFTDDMGKKMLAGAAVLQVLGALVIRKIVDIKV